jgi:hypothetical protein
VDVVQSVRTSDCGSEGRGFEPHLPPEKNPGFLLRGVRDFLFDHYGIYYSILHPKNSVF